MTDTISPRMPVLMGALALLMRARTFQAVTVLEVDDLRGMAEALLPEDCQLRAAVLLFATQFEAGRADAFALHDAGQELARALERVTRPPVADAARVDIHG